MAIVHTLGRIASTLMAIVQTRIKLAVLEMEEESIRLLSYLALVLLAMLCLAMAVVLAAFLVIVLFWDTHRIATIAITTGVFAAGGLALLFGVRSNFRRKPKLLSFTIAELGKDLDSMRNLTEVS